MTPWGIESETFPLVAQFHNQLCHCVPIALSYFLESAYKRVFRQIFMKLWNMKCHGSLSKGSAAFTRSHTDRDAGRRVKTKKSDFSNISLVPHQVKNTVRGNKYPRHSELPLSDNNDITQKSLKQIWTYTQNYFKLTARYIVFYAVTSFGHTSHSHLQGSTLF
jgi:hypothetical protein